MNEEQTPNLGTNAPGEPSLKNEVFGFIWEVIKVVAISLAIIVPIRYYLVQPFFVKGASMEPNFEDGDYILVNEISYRFETPQRGDVVIFRYPKDPTQFFIKRIIGLPGETVEVKDNKVTIYNKKNPEGYILPEPYLAATQKTLGNLVMKMDDNDFFVMGDNRLQSFDSRSWGPVNKSLITGKAFLRPWPLNKIEKVPAVSYPNN